MSIIGLPFEETHEISPDGLFYVMKEKYVMPYRIARDRQLFYWFNGVSKHNVYSGECCPDFSCCRPELRWNTIRREEFLRSNEEERERMMLRALAQVTEPDGVMKYAENIQPVVRVLGALPANTTTH